MRQPIIFQHDFAAATLRLDLGSIATLEGLYSEIQGQGNAKEVMKQVIEFADDRDLELWLKAKPFGARKGLSEDQLVNFYRKFGFEIVNPSVAPTMMRRNRRNNMPHNEKRDYVK